MKKVGMKPNQTPPSKAIALRFSNIKTKGAKIRLMVLGEQGE